MSDNRKNKNNEMMPFIVHNMNFIYLFKGSNIICGSRPRSGFNKMLLC